MKQYCEKCGKPTEYSLNAPLFCGYCGGSFAALPKINIPQIVQPQTIPTKQPKIWGNKYIKPQEDEENIDIDSIANNLDPNGVQVVESNNKGTKLKEVALSPPTPKSELFKRPRRKKNEVLQELATESKSSKSIDLTVEKE